jgi:hypothetical protein
MLAGSRDRPDHGRPFVILQMPQFVFEAFQPVRGHWKLFHRVLSVLS